MSSSTRPLRHGSVAVAAIGAALAGCGALHARDGTREISGSIATVAGRRYETFAFDATAFPSGRLRTSLLTPR